MIHTTRRLLILSRLADRQSVITIANGFTVDAGLHLYLGAAPELTDADPDDAIAIVPRDDLPKESGYQWTTLPVEIQALGKAAGGRDAWSKLEVLLGAIKIATELEDRVLADPITGRGALLKGDMVRGATRVVERQPGSATIALGVVYVCQYIEPWGNPTIGVEEDT